MDLYVIRISNTSVPSLALLVINLIIDTGSSHTWVGAERPYVRTQTSVHTYNAMAPSYGSGWFFGIEYTDAVTFASSLVISGLLLKVLSVLMYWPVDLMVNSPFPATNSSLHQERENLANSNWGIGQTIRYGISPVPITESTLILLGTSFYCIWVLYSRVNNLKHHLFARSSSQSRSFFESPQRNMPTSSRSFSPLVTGHSSSQRTQIWPRALNELTGGERWYIYLVAVNDIGWTARTGLDFIIGHTFLESFNSVFNTGMRRIGLATTQFTMAKYN
ncbi:hypothetical protein V8E52_008752 [Russula decolorans]